MSSSVLDTKSSATDRTEVPNSYRVMVEKTDAEQTRVTNSQRKIREREGRL